MSKTISKRKTKSLPKLLQDAQKAFNSWVRLRDSGEKCISCNNPGNQAGHYFPVKGFSSLRFHEWNVNIQCAACNCYQHGNQAMYRIGLVKKIGEDKVKELEELAIGNRVYKWSREELNEIILKYK